MMRRDAATKNGEPIQQAGGASVKAQRPGSIIQRRNPYEVATLVALMSARPRPRPPPGPLQVDDGVLDSIV
jgi:hypothetical protein